MEWTTIDLAEVRDLDDAVQVLEFDDVESLAPDPPSPAGHDHESYGDELDVEPFNPYEGTGTGENMNKHNRDLAKLIDDYNFDRAFRKLTDE